MTIATSGGRVWRTHAFGYLLRRTKGHTHRMWMINVSRARIQKWEGFAEVVGVVDGDFYLSVRLSETDSYICPGPSPIRTSPPEASAIFLQCQDRSHWIHL